MALQGNKTYEGFHNSLGECYRTLGRIKDAQKQFQVGWAGPDLRPCLRPI